MNTLIYTTVLGLACLVLELLKLRKAIAPLVAASLLVIAGLNIQHWNDNEGYYSNMIFIDNYAVAFSGIIVLIGAAIVAMTHQFYKDEQERISDYIAVIVFTLCGGIMMVSFANMATLFLGIEILSVSMYILAGSKRKNLASNESGLKYFLMGSFATGFLLMGITLVYGVTGSFDISTISEMTYTGQNSQLMTVGISLLLIAMLFKGSVAPFHFWAPDVYQGAPSLITAFMSTAGKVAAFGAMFRLFSYGFGSVFNQYEPLLMVFVTLTLIIGNFSALRQESFKRILAFSGISHAGYFLMSVMSNYQVNANTLFYYALAYSFASIAAFSVAIEVGERTGSDRIDAFKGLAYKHPYAATGLILAMLSMAGIPPFAGFFAKYMVFTDAIAAGYINLVILGVVCSIVAVYYYFKVIWAMFTKVEDTTPFKMPVLYQVILWVSTLALIALGVAPSYWINLLSF